MQRSAACSNIYTPSSYIQFYKTNTKQSSPGVLILARSAFVVPFIELIATYCLAKNHRIVLSKNTQLIFHSLDTIFYYFLKI